jgi:biotin-(acetyl-CoA carboxylase) ligase
LKVKIAAQVEEGKFQGIDEDGNLLLETKRDLKKITAGEIYKE